MYYTSFRREHHYCQRQQPQSHNGIDQSKGEDKSAPEPYVFLNPTDNIGTMRKYAAVIVVRESGRDVRIAETVDILGCPVDC